MKAVGVACQPSSSTAGSTLPPLSRPQLAKARRVRAVELFEDGVSNAEIATAVGVCAESVRRWRRVQFGSVGGPLSRANFPHRHAFYEIVHVTGGRGAHVLDLVHRPLDPPHLCVITPGQVHRWENTEDLTGRVMLFNEDFLLSQPQDAVALDLLADRPWLRLRDSQDGIPDLLAEMEREYQTLGTGYAGVLRAYLHILIARALRNLEPGPERETAAPGRAAELGAAFIRLISSPGGTDSSVASCAKELGVSAGHLHALVKEATGQTPGRLIRHRQTLAAKRLLARTDLTIRQVAQDTGFADPAYFCRFFRRETGLTPGDYRAAIGPGSSPQSGGIHHDPRIPSIAAAAKRTVG
ncbi:helix-turn-helix domain-containing protein [Streptomyces sp. NPDC059382]|uniref:helix-turn-helix transcriptional regulator n=1 Tax=Streptomyces sp. NPDC059382 TaxID=3346816 RepID=UPI0036A93A5C